MNKAIFERIRKTHTAWQADEIEEGQEVGRDYAEKESSYVELLVVRDDLLKAERALKGPEPNTSRLPEMLGSTWEEMILQAGHDYPVEKGAPSLGWQIGFMRGMAKVLEEYETELAKRWESRPAKERQAK